MTRQARIVFDQDNDVYEVFDDDTNDCVGYCGTWEEAIAIAHECGYKRRYTVTLQYIEWFMANQLA